MLVGWRTCRPPEGARRLGAPSWAAVVRWAAVLLLATASLACSSNVAEVQPRPTTGDATVDTDVPPGNPGTLVPRPATGVNEPEVLAIEPLIAFLDACVADAGLIGPCHCAAGRIERGFDTIDLEIFEDRMSGALEFAPEIASSLVDCREADPAPAWPQQLREAYLADCAQGSDRLRSLCACSLARAQEVVPVHRLGEFLDSNEVRPDLVDFINLCL